MCLSAVMDLMLDEVENKRGNTFLEYAVLSFGCPRARQNFRCDLSAETGEPHVGLRLRVRKCARVFDVVALKDCSA